MSKCHITSENIKTHVLELTFSCKDDTSNVYPDVYPQNILIKIFLHLFFSEKGYESTDFGLFLICELVCLFVSLVSSSPPVL